MKVFRVSPRDVDPPALREAAQILADGGIVAFPTETVYGLGASCRRPEAVARLAELKGRPAGKPFSFHLARPEQALDLVPSLPPAALRLAERYWPGPLTLVVPSRATEGETIGMRVPANEIACRIIDLAGSPLLVPSANPGGLPPAVTADEATAYFDGKIDALVDGGPCLIKQASTVVRVDQHGFQVLREGIITREMVHQLLAGKSVLFVCTGNTCRSPMAAALYRKHLAAKLGKSPDELTELGYRISSAGTFATGGSAPSEHAAAAMEELGCSLAGHRSQPITPRLIAQADRIYAMSYSHHDVVLQTDPAAAPRLSLLSDTGIADPVGADLETYRACAREIEALVQRLLESWH